MIEHMDVGRFMFFVADDERWWTQWRTETLTPGEEWRLDFDFVGGETVQLQATPREGAQLPKERIWVSTTRAGLSGEVVQDTLYLDEDGAFTLQGLGPGQAVFSIEAQSAHETGIGSLEIVAGGGPYTLTIPIGPEDWHIKLLDSTGAAIGGASVYLYGPDVWEMTPTLEATSSGPPVAVEVYHLAQLELAFLHEDGSPAAGLPVDLVHQDLAESVSSWLEAGRAIQTSSTTLTTNAQGRLTLSAIPRGAYTWQINDAAGTAHTSATLTTISIP